MDNAVEFELKLPERIYSALREAAAKTRKSEEEVALDAIQAYLAQIDDIDPLMGLFADELDLIEQIVAGAMASREQTPWRITESGNG
jgi:hypothetical protein